MTLKNNNLPYIRKVFFVSLERPLNRGMYIHAPNVSPILWNLISSLFTSLLYQSWFWFSVPNTRSLSVSRHPNLLGPSVCPLLAQQRLLLFPRRRRHRFCFWVYPLVFCWSAGSVDSAYDLPERHHWQSQPAPPMGHLSQRTEKRDLKRWFFDCRVSDTWLERLHGRFGSNSCSALQ